MAYYRQQLSRPQSESRVTLYNITDNQLLRLKSEVFAGADCYYNSLGIKREQVKTFFTWYEEYLCELVEQAGISEEENRTEFYRKVMDLDRDPQNFLECHKHWLIQQGCM